MEENHALRLQALKAAAYDALVQIEQLQARLRQINQAIAEEAQALQTAEASPAGNGTAPATPRQAVAAAS